MRRLKEPLPDFWAKGKLDTQFLIYTIALLLVGLVTLYSASYPWGYLKFTNPTYYIKHQLVYAALGVAAMLIVSKVNYKYFRILAIVGFCVSIVLLLVVLVTPEQRAGFKRWLKIGPLPQFQPSEVAKVFLVMFLAWAMERYYRLITGKGLRDSDRMTKSGKLLPPFIVSLKPTFLLGGVIILVAGLVYVENHHSGAILLAVLGIAMLYIGEFRRGWFILAAALIVAVAMIVIAKPELLKEYAGERIIAWLDKSFEPLGARWQTNQSLNAIGSGGLFGAGLGNSIQKYYYVSESFNDMIFSIYAEEMGFVFCVALLVLFCLFIGRGVIIAIRARDRFGAYMTMGYMVHVGLQVLLNIAVATDSIPNTGISLPFFSSGGTALVMLMFELGVVLSVSRSAYISKQK